MEEFFLEEVFHAVVDLLVGFLLVVEFWQDLGRGVRALAGVLLGGRLLGVLFLLWGSVVVVCGY